MVSPSRGTVSSSASGFRRRSSGLRVCLFSALPIFACSAVICTAMSAWVMDRCIFGIVQQFVGLGLPQRYRGSTGDRGPGFLRYQPALLGAGPDERNLPDEVERQGGREGESLVDRVRERRVSYVSPCLCPLVPAGLDYPEFSTEQLRWGGDMATGLSEERGGKDLGRFSDLKPRAELGPVLANTAMTFL